MYDLTVRLFNVIVHYMNELVLRALWSLFVLFFILTQGWYFISLVPFPLPFPFQQNFFSTFRRFQRHFENEFWDLFVVIYVSALTSKKVNHLLLIFITLHVQQCVGSVSGSLIELFQILVNCSCIFECLIKEMIYIRKHATTKRA